MDQLWRQAAAEAVGLASRLRLVCLRVGSWCRCVCARMQMAVVTDEQQSSEVSGRWLIIALHSPADRRSAARPTDAAGAEPHGTWRQMATGRGGAAPIQHQQAHPLP